MGVAVTYVNAAQFTVAGNQVAYLPKNRVLEAVQGTNALVVVTAAIYQSVPANTLVTVEPMFTGGGLTADLTEIRPGPVINDGTAQRCNIAPHTHAPATDELDDGGPIPAASLSQADVDNLESLPVPTTGDDRKLVAIVVGATGFEFIEFSGTTNQVVITNGSGTKTFSLPQNIHTGATPTFAGLTLSALTGVLCGRGATAVNAVSPSAALQILRQDPTNTFLEFADVKLGELADVDDTVSSAPQAGDIYYYDAVSSKIKRLPIGVDGQVVTVSGGLPSYQNPAGTGAISEAIAFMYSQLGR